MTEPITWAAIEPAYRDLADALGKVDTILMRRADLSERQAFRAAFVALIHGVESTLNRLTLLHNEHIDDPDPDRPLEVVLAELEAAGHQHIRLVRYSGAWLCETARTQAGMPAAPSAGGTREQWDRWEDEVEAGVAHAADPVVAAAARLAEVLALHAARVPTIRHYILWMPLEGEPFGDAVCGTGCDSTTSTQAPADVNCSACLAWVEQNLTFRTVPGPEEVASEHESHVAGDPVARKDAARETGASEDSV